MEPLVSIIAPCYNGAKYLGGFFQGILSQKYRNIELIFVDDGSTDDTEMTAKLFGEELVRQGMKFVYIKQRNIGQAAAINQGLAVFQGDFLTWVDADDIIMPDNISKKVVFLKQNPECGFVLSGLQTADADYPENVLSKKIRKKPETIDNLFEDYIYERNVVWGPGTILVRRECILNAIPTRQIYESREGQNWQLMLPLSYMYRCGYVEEPLVTCIQHNDSHSRRNRTLNDVIRREDNFVVLCRETIQSIPGMSDKEKSHWVKAAGAFHYQKIMRLAAEHLSVKDYFKAREKVIEFGGTLKKSDLLIPSFFNAVSRMIKRRLKRIIVLVQNN